MKYIKKIQSNYTFNIKWGAISAKLDKGEFCTFLFEEDNEKFYFQYIKRDISDELKFLESNTYFDVVTPFDYGGFYYTSEKILEKGIKELEKIYMKENVIAGFYRFNPLLKQNYTLIKDYIEVTKLQEHVVIPLDTDYRKKLSVNKRRDINRAQRFGYEFIDNDSVENFHKIYTESMDRIGANNYFKFPKEILNEFIPFGKIFSIKYENNTVNSVFVIVEEENIYYFLGSGLTKYLDYGFNSLLLYLICDYYKDTKKLFYLGGGKDGLYQYKKRFSNDRVPFYIGKKIYNQEIYSKIVSKINRQDNNFFPQYREKII